MPAVAMSVAAEPGAELACDRLITGRQLGTCGHKSLSRLEEGCVSQPALAEPPFLLLPGWGVAVSPPSSEHQWPWGCTGA